MKSAIFYASLAATLAPTIFAQRVVSLDIDKPAPASAPQLSDLLRRDLGSYSQVITNNISVRTYYAKVTVGTPPQPITLIVDTGSSDTWVIDDDISGCGKDACTTPFAAHDSSTVQMMANTLLNITYGDGSNVLATMMEDTLTIGGTKVHKLQMGLAYTVVGVTSGILGLGLREGESPPADYSNIMDLFYDQDLIGTKAFSLYLNALQSPTGNILFGGIDKAKFTGELRALPLVPDALSNKVSSYFVTLSSLSLTFDNGTNKGFPLGDKIVLLDSGTTFSYLPNSTVQPLFQALGVSIRQDQSQGGLMWIDCGILDSQRKATFDFRFGGGGSDDGLLISVPMDQMVLDLRPYSNPEAAESCLLGIVPTSENSHNAYLLGDTFLRSAYVVYDLANHQVALAQALPNATSSEIVEFGKDATAIPGAVGVASGGTSVMQSATGLPGGPGGKPLPTVTVTAALDPTETNAIGGKKNAGSVSRSVPAGADLLVVGLVMFWAGLGSLTGSRWLCLQV
ncbi:aspartic-type endopeptidase OPSB [Apiospora kogelbergensis]